MHKRRTSRVIFLAAGLVAATLALQGCAVVDELVYKQRSSAFPTAEAAREAWDLDAAWVPADAKDVRVVESTVAGASDAVLLVSSDTALDPALCAEVIRQSGAGYTIDGAPDAYRADTVFACGPWSVIPSDEGWFGWTPNHPNELAQSPSPR
ncbi:hypothetical protein [Microbacterium terregens]|jgi:hypothetical protein|uniref:Lipoprotein n=1 Tax=Microbacterium terregens TaxID=69363 RepID=A0ABV5T2Z5_9MICO